MNPKSPQLVYRILIVFLSLYTSAAFSIGGRVQVMSPFAVAVERYQFSQKDGEPFQIVVDDHSVVACGTDRIYKQSKLNATTWFVQIFPETSMPTCSSPKSQRSGAVVGFEKRLSGKKESLTLTLYVYNTLKKSNEDLALTINSAPNVTVNFKDLGEETFNRYRINDWVGSSYKLDLSVKDPTLLDCWPQNLKQYKLDFSYYMGDVTYPAEDYLFLDLNGTCQKPTSIPSSQVATVIVAEGDQDSFRMLSIMVPAMPFTDDLFSVKVRF